MKNIIRILFALFLFVGVANAQWTTYTFSAGDTTTTFSVSNATIVYFTMKDSSMSGTDSLAIYLVSQSPITGESMYTQIAAHDISQATQTTNTTFITAGDNTTKTFIITESMWGDKITATFFIRRLNTRTGEAVYAPKTRLAFKYD